VINRAELEATAKNQLRDEVFEVCAKTGRTLLNDNWISYVESNQYQQLLRGETTQLAFHSILNPSIVDGFATVFMASANF